MCFTSGAAAACARGASAAVGSHASGSAAAGAFVANAADDSLVPFVPEIVPLIRDLHLEESFLRPCLRRIRPMTLPLMACGVEALIWKRMRISVPVSAFVAAIVGFGGTLGMLIATLVVTAMYAGFVALFPFLWLGVIDAHGETYVIEHVVRKVLLQRFADWAWDRPRGTG